MVGQQNSYIINIQLFNHFKIKIVLNINSEFYNSHTKILSINSSKDKLQ